MTRCLTSLHFFLPAMLRVLLFTSVVLLASFADKAQAQQIILLKLDDVIARRVGAKPEDIIETTTDAKGKKSEKRVTIGQGNYDVHSPAWAVDFQKLALATGATCHVKYPGQPTEGYDDIWNFIVKQLTAITPAP